MGFSLDKIKHKKTKAFFAGKASRVKYLSQCLAKTDGLSGLAFRLVSLTGKGFSSFCFGFKELVFD